MPGGAFTRFPENFAGSDAPAHVRPLKVQNPPPAYPASELIPTVERAFTDNTVVVLDITVDYSENVKLTEKLGALVCPI